MTARGRLVAGRGAAAPVAARRPAGAKGILRLQRLIGNARVQRLLAQRAPEDGMSLEELLAGLRDDAPGAAPLPETMLKAIGALSGDEALSAYLVESNRRTVREAYNETDARRILGALLKKPYAPGGEQSIFYEVLRDTDKAAYDAVNQEVNKRLEAETGVTGKLDWDKATDRGFARRWLMLRDDVMAERRRSEEEEEEREFKADLLAKAATPADLHVALQGLDPEMQRSLLTDSTFKRDLKDALGDWDEFAGCIEDLGGVAPTEEDLRYDSTVLSALEAAWDDSLPNSPMGLAKSREELKTHNHEEGGWIYFNLVTNKIVTRRQSAEDSTAFEIDDAGNLMPTISLELPPKPDDCVLVANFHTHPNEDRYAGASGPDGRSIAGKAVPGLLRDSLGVGSYGETKQRASLKGGRGYP